MNIELRKWSVEDKEVLIKMCNSIDRSFLSDRLPNPYTNASAEWWLTMVKDNEGKKGVFREIVVDGKIVGTISVEQKDDVYRKDSEIGYYLLQEVYSKGIMSEGVLPVLNVITMSLFVTAVLEYTESLVAPIVIHFLWNGVGAIILGGVSLAEDYPHLFNMVISGNSILSGGSCKIEGSIVVLFMNLILMLGFVMAKKKRDKNL